MLPQRRPGARRLRIPPQRAEAGDARTAAPKIPGARSRAEAATGTTATLVEGRSYPHRISDSALAATFRENWVALGQIYTLPMVDVGIGSSDSAAVSHRVPMIHPYLQIGDLPTGAHTPEFAVAARSPCADASLAEGTIALTWTAAEVLLRPELREALRAGFREQLGRDPEE